MGVMITYYGYNNPMYNAHKNGGGASYVAKYGMYKALHHSIV